MTGRSIELSVTRDAAVPKPEPWMIKLAFTESGMALTMTGRGLWPDAGADDIVSALQSHAMSRYRLSIVISASSRYGSVSCVHLPVTIAVETFQWMPIRRKTSVLDLCPERPGR